MEFKKLPIGTGMKFGDLPLGAEFIFIPNLSQKPIFMGKCKKVTVILSHDDQRLAFVSQGGVILTNDKILEKEVIVLL